jgi:hypothetical protein
MRLFTARSVEPYPSTTLLKSVGLPIFATIDFTDTIRILAGRAISPRGLPPFSAARATSRPLAQDDRSAVQRRNAGIG